MPGRRRYSRFLPDNDRVWILLPEDRGRIPARILNESYGGLGVVCADASLLAVGEPVEVELDECPYPAVIASLRPTPGEGVYVGLEWRGSSTPESSVDDD